MSVLEARGLHVAFEGQAALRQIDLRLGAPSVCALVGPNGAGKSTLLQCLAGLLRPTAGRVLLDGCDVFSMAAPARARRIAFVPQFLETSFDLEVERLVELGRLHRQNLGDRLALRGLGGVDRQAVERSIARLGLGSLRARPLSTLSGGERARVMIAMALAQEAPWMLLDEPTAHLDIGHAQAILAILAELAAQGVRVVIALHDLTLAGLYAERVVLLHRGALVADGRAPQVLAKETLERVFSTSLEVLKHPSGGRPLVFPGLAGRLPAEAAGGGRGPSRQEPSRTKDRDG